MACTTRSRRSICSDTWTSSPSGSMKATSKTTLWSGSIRCWERRWGGALRTGNSLKWRDVATSLWMKESDMETTHQATACPDDCPLCALSDDQLFDLGLDLLLE